MLKTEIKSEHYTHRILWATVQRQMNNADLNPTGSFYDYIAAIIFASLTFEAYLNFIGDRIAPDLWVNEKTNPEIRGFRNKLDKIYSLCDFIQGNENERPYSSIWKLRKIRDLISHGKIEKHSDSIIHKETDYPEHRLPEINTLVSDTSAKELIYDIETVIESIHRCASNKFKEEDRIFHEKALTGVLGHTNSHTGRA